MFLYDYLKAIEILADCLESYYSICIDKIQCAVFGDWFFFYPDRNNKEYYAVNVKTARIEYRYPDTWRNPDHRDIIQEGN